jgi:HSP20 family protein
MLTTLKRQNPFFPVFSDSFFRENFLNDSDWATSPAVNIAEDGNDFRIEVAAPGLGKDDFNIHVEKRMLEISSEKETSSESKDEKYHRKEFSYTSFKRTFSLPEYADVDNIKASYNNGILNVTVPKLDQAKEKPARAISIE